MFLADLHVHSTFSDGSMTIPELVDFYGRRGFGCIAVTDHICETGTFLGSVARYLRKTLTGESFPEYLSLLKEEGERAKDQYNMVVIPGFELSKNSLSQHRSAHILGIGIDRFVPAEGEILELIRGVKNQGALAIAAHPVPTGKAELQTLHLWDRREELRSELDAWEVASGTDIFPQVRASGLPLVATTDLHHARQINGWKTLFRCERKAEAVMQAIREQSVEFQFYSEPLAVGLFRTGTPALRPGVVPST
jgi:hypothetical protein